MSLHDLIKIGLMLEIYFRSVTPSLATVSNLFSFTRRKITRENHPKIQKKLLAIFLSRRAFSIDFPKSCSFSHFTKSPI